MSDEQNKDFMRHFLAASVSNDSTVFKECMSPDFVAHVMGNPMNRELFIQHMHGFKVAFNDMQVVVEDLITDGKKIVARTTWRGTHNGDFMGLPPTGRQIEIDAYIVERLENGKSVEHWSLFDQMTMMQQLGLIPPPSAR